MKSAWNILYKIALFTFSSLLIYMICSIVLAYIPVNSTPVKCAKNTTIYASTNGMHVDIILPKRSVEPMLLKQLNISGTANFVAFGWGDKGFYLDTPTWADLKFSTACEAMLINSETAMHITQYGKRKESWKSGKVCPANLAKLNQYIADSFAKTADGKIDEIVGAGYTDADRFYEAIGNYNAIKTCNVWANRGLKVAGVKTAFWAPFEFGIMWHFEE